MKKTYLLLVLPFCFQEPGSAQSPNPNWHSLGPVNMRVAQGRINCIAAAPGQANTLFVGTPGGGVWRSDDAGATWLPRSDSLPVLGVSAIVIDPSSPNTVYIATGDADGGTTPSVGVWKSIDGGTNWASTALSFPLSASQHIYNLIMAPGDSQQLFAATTDGVYQTSNGGASWQRSTPGGNTWCEDIQFKPGSSTVLYVTCKGANFFRSTNGGTSWTQVTTGLPTDGVGRSALGVSANNSAAVYLLYGDSGSGNIYGLYRSTDSGVSFSQQAGNNLSSVGGNNMQEYDLTLAVSPTDYTMVAAGELNIGVSTDGGATWPTVTHNGTLGVHIDIHKVAFLNGVLFACTDGGLHKTVDGGSHWTDLSPTLQIAQIFKLYGAPQNPSLIYVGEQDNGLQRYSGGAWSQQFGGDFGQPIVDPTDENIVYVLGFGYYYKTTDAFATYPPAVLDITDAEGDGSSLAISPTDGQTLFAGYQNVWKTTDGGSTWGPISSFSDGNSCSAIFPAPSNPSYLYVIRGGEVWRTPDDGATWTMRSIPAPGTAIGLAISSSDPNRVWLAQNDSSANKIYASTDGGATWSPFTGSLPDRNVSAIVYEGGSNDALYAGFDAGIYYRDAAMSDWQPFNDGLPNAPVTDLQIEYSSLTLRAATFGRGLWETYLHGGAPTPPLLSGPDLLAINQTGHYTFAPVAKAFGYQWRQKRLQPYSLLDGAENGPTNFNVLSSGGYSVVQSAVAASGSSFHLAQPDGADQILTLNRTLLPRADTVMQFASLLGYATDSQIAKLQVSPDSGKSWQDLYSQAGDDSAEFTFSTRTVPLSDYAGKAVQLRFLYTFLGGSSYTQTDPYVGWYLDDILITNIDEASAPIVTDIGPATSFDFSSSQAGNYALDARAKVYGGNFLDWGPVKSVNVSGDRPQLFIGSSGGRLVLDWADNAFHLEMATKLSPPDWMPFAGTAPVNIPLPSSGNAYFRLVK